MQRRLSNIVRQMLGRIPQWLRVDLSSSDALLRERAEDALSAMIVAALAEPDTGPELVLSPSPSAMMDEATSRTGI